VKKLVLSLLALAMLGGCDDSRSNDNASPATPIRTYGLKCPAYTPCGGDLVGTWLIADHCGWGDQGFGSKECSLYSWFDGETAGTMTFNADGRYGTDLRGTSVYIEDAPLESQCGGGSAGGGFDNPDGGKSAPPDAGPPTCQERERVERLLLGRRTPVMDAVSVSCTTHGSRCTCTWVRPDAGGVKSGTYSTEGSELMIDGAPHRYCVKGNELFLIERYPSEYGSYSARLVRQR
jgi:hypothetical protein